MILFIDNYDSFVHNLARYIEQLGVATKVVRNDSVSLAEIRAINPEKIVLSPGPCDPDKSGITMSVIETFGSGTPILGVCLGHQAIGQVFGGKVIPAAKPMHGKSSVIHHSEKEIFRKIPSPLKVGRYHSLIVCRETLPECLQITAESEDGLIMAMRHKHLPVFGVQFHPESIITEHGYTLLDNFLTLDMQT